MWDLPELCKMGGPYGPYAQICAQNNAKLEYYSNIYIDHRNLILLSKMTE